MAKRLAVPVKYDAVVVGAGFTGLYTLYKLRELGLKVVAFEAGNGVGGTWFWNRYPGARVDCQFPTYQYTFSKALFDKWNWSERFPAQEETERYLNFCADELDLRKDIHLNTRVTAAEFDESTERWAIRTDDGKTYDAQFFVPCTGILSSPISPFPGSEKFKGQLFHTARWPKAPVDFTGKRVGVVGVGATGMQVVQTIAPQVGSLKVFIRTANYSIDLNNPKLTDADRESTRKDYAKVVADINKSFGGLGFDVSANGSFHDHTPQQRQAIYEKIWADGTLRFWLGVWFDIIFDEEANREISDFVRNKIRGQINDPETADLLTPDFRFGTRRVPLQNGFYAAFNQDNVEAVGIKDDPIAAITEKGLKLKSGKEYELDILILATGFDAGRTLSQLNVHGRGGVTVKQVWDKDVRTTMGLMLHGFPNMFTPGAPLAPINAFCNVPHCSQHQGEWVAEAVRYMRDNGIKVLEPTKEVEDAWVQTHDNIVNMSLFPKTNTWYMGDNIEGKKRRLLAWLGGNPDYEQRCREVREKGFPGFATA
ncbi:MAG: NAD(P)/FAD-dependent oxidoreductase [Nevskiaceae bacterium]|nr:MAG: NAD(P)/FAD-dependent oxidoreductase [Nevskiaceae bacterium]TBR71829.1 MAG: NAD(P)/FAD-dependent oxidoreductase [Nevskiaceae bacterium]